MKHIEEPLVDAALVRRCQAGDAESFTEIFEAYKNLVFRTAFLMLDSADEAEDVLQDVFIQVHRSLNSYDPVKGALSTWLYSITVNNCLNRRRRWRFFSGSLDEVAEKNIPAVVISEQEKSDIENRYRWWYQLARRPDNHGQWPAGCVKYGSLQTVSPGSS